MQPVTEVQEFATSAAQRSNGNSKTVNETRIFQKNEKSMTDHLSTVSSDVYPPGTMTVCRVCLAMNVRMYHISEHKPRVMYERVTGLEVNKEYGVLPQTLCWECVARLSSANHFIEKAIKSQLILLNKSNGDRFITISDIESIDRTQNQLKSSLSSKLYEVNHSDLHIIDGTDVFNKPDNHITDKSLNINCDEVIIDDGKEKQVSEIKVEVSIKIEKVDENDAVGVDVGDDKDEIKNETECSIYNEFASNVKEECMSDNKVSFDDGSNKEMLQEDPSEVHTQQRWRKRNNSSTLLRKQSTTLPRCKELIVVLEDIMLSKYNTQDSAHSLQDNNTECRSLPNIFDDKGNIVEAISNNTEAVTTTKYNHFNTESSNTSITKRTVDVSTSTMVAISDSSLMLDGIKSLKKRFICDFCDYAFCYKSVLIRHIRKHSKLHILSIKKRFICDLCDYAFCYKSALIRHIRKHPKLHSCSYCSFKTYRVEFFNKHIKSNHIRSSLKCCYCSYETYIKYNLKQHINTKHTKETPYYCSYCSFKTYSKSSVDRHINAKHTQNISYNCTYCSYETYCSSSLSSHVKFNHRKLSSFSCSYCCYETYLKVNLRRHINMKHSKNTCFSCSDCSYKTYNKSDLNRHTNIKHSNPICFSCPHCVFETFYKHNLTKHIKNKHP